MEREILIIEDDLGIAESLKLLVEFAGHKATVAEDDSIIRAPQSGSYRPDLILLDYWLPKQNGGDITKRLKNDPRTRDIPILMMSASYNVRAAAKEAGANDFVAKPYDMDDLLGRIDMFLAQPSRNVLVEA